MAGKAKYPTPARQGWGQTAQMLHPNLATLGKLGKFGGIVPKDDDDIKKSDDKNDTKMKEPTTKTIDEEEHEEEDFMFSNLDLFLLVGFFLFSAGLVVTILILPYPNMWLQNEDMVYVSAGMILLGMIVFLGAIIPCFCSCFWKTLCCRKSKSFRGNRKMKKVIHVNPANGIQDKDVEELIASVYVNKIVK